MKRALPAVCFLALLTPAGCNLDFAELPLDERDTGPADTSAAPDVVPDLSEADLPELDTPEADASDASDLAETSADVTAADTTDADDLADTVCMPATCESLGVTCGEHDDPCGGTVLCPACDDGLVCSEAGACVLDISPTSAVRIPDTATHLCVTENNDGNPTCPLPGEPFFGQDASYDIRLPAYAPAAESVLDQVTGLTWLRQPISASPLSIETVCPAVTVEGQTDWRLPSLPEVMTLLDYGRASELYDTAVFANLDALATATYDATQRYYVGATNGVVAPGQQAEVHVLCVRGTWPGPQLRVVDAAAGIAVDRSVALMWTTQPRGQSSWREALAGCEALDLGGHQDWRMPTLKELYSLIVHESGGRATVDAAVFGEVSTHELWSATPDGATSDGSVSDSAIRTFRANGDAGMLDARNGRHWLCVRDTAP